MDRTIMECIRIALKNMPVVCFLEYENYGLMASQIKDIFIREYLFQNRMCSEDEAEHAFDLFLGENEYLMAVFDRIIEVSRHYLYAEGFETFCHKDMLLEFRELTMGIGQLVFTSAYWAFKHVNIKCDYPPTRPPLLAKSDDIRLQHILEEGIAENHFHLNGSAPTALLSWVCLMNHPSKRERDFRDFHEQRNFFSAPQEDKIYSLHEEIIIASAIRLMLFYAFQKNASLFRTVKEWLHDYQEGLETASDLQSLIDQERATACTTKLDYVVYPGYVDPLLEAVSGERAFQIHMFEYVLSRKKESECIVLIYAYLLIYCRFYSEMVQSNQAVGFYNFMRYQDRKEVFLNQYPTYSFQVKKMAIELALSQRHVRSLEARISPKTTRRALINQQRLFSSQMFVCSHKRCRLCKYYNKALESCEETKCRKIFGRLFFAYHFIKSPDIVYKPSLDGVGIGDFICRHERLRRGVVWPIIIRIIELRRNSHILDNIYGLDACNREIGCRPEVFAPYFRYAREQDSYVDRDNLDWISPPKLRITYHVGEDFLDILDGIRAIHEALIFMELKGGDRLGHALALGVDIPEWYRMKKRRVLISRQDAIDNIAFLYDMITHSRRSYPMLLEKIKTDFNYQFRYIYPEMEAVTITDYYLSMLLRGDEPELYKNVEEAHYNNVFEDSWKRLSLKKADDARKNEVAIRLMHLYHYSSKSKYLGAESIEIEVDEEYIQAVQAVQQIVREEVVSLGVGIECNPSSNILIGTSKDYYEHPILNFNHRGLSKFDPDGRPEMFVSINTDDIGVFDTDLDNEYALMVCALQKQRDENNHQLYENEDIYRWVDNIRRMGIEQSFKLGERGN